MDEDEEVILEGSPLFSHLREVGYSDFATKASQNSRTHLENTIEAVRYSPKADDSHPFFVEAFAFSKLRSEFINRLESKVLEAQILEEDDLFILERLSPSMKDSLSHLECSLSWNYSHMFLPAILISLRYSVEKDLQFVDEMIGCLMKSSKVISKLLKLMKELEVIGKRFASIHDHNYEMSLLTGGSLLMRDISSALLGGHAKISSIESSQRWTNAEGLFMHRFEPLIYGNELSIADMKANRNLIVGQTSAFFTQLILYLERHSKKFGFRTVIKRHQIMAIRRQTSEVEKLLDLASSFWFKGATINSPKSPSSTSRISDITNALDSLLMHTRLAANHISMFRKLIESNTGNAAGADVLSEVQSSYDSVKYEFVSCMGCLDEAWERSRRLFCPSVASEEVVSPNLEEEDVRKCLCEERLNEQSLCEEESMGHFVPEDEVYEFVVRSDLPEEDLTEEWLPESQVDRNLKKEQKERCKRVLQEIQPILYERRKKWEAREEKALERVNRRQKEPIPILRNDHTSFGVDDVDEEPVRKELREDECVMAADDGGGDTNDFKYFTKLSNCDSEVKSSGGLKGDPNVGHNSLNEICFKKFCDVTEDEVMKLDEDNSSYVSSSSSCSQSSSSDLSSSSSSLTHPSDPSSSSVSPLLPTVALPHSRNAPESDERLHSRNAPESSVMRNSGGDEDPRIDWTTCGFPSAGKLAPEERFVPCAFPSICSSAVPPFRSLNEEVFRGVGENEDEEDSG